MCVSHDDEEATEVASPMQAVSGNTGGHKRNLSSGTADNSPIRRSKRQRSTINLKEESSSADSESEEDPVPKKQPTKSTPSRAKKPAEPASVTKRDKLASGVKNEEDQSIKVEAEAEAEAPASAPKAKAVKKGKKTKEEKEAEAMPLAPRTRGLRMFVGAHVSAAKGQSLNSIGRSMRLIRRMLRRIQLDQQQRPYRVSLNCILICPRLISISI